MRSLLRVLAIAVGLIAVVGGGYVGFQVLVPQPADFVNVDVTITNCVVYPKTATVSVKANNQINWKVVSGGDAQVSFTKTPFHAGKVFDVPANAIGTNSGPLKRRTKFCAAIGWQCEYDYTVTQNGQICDPKVIVTK